MLLKVQVTASTSRFRVAALLTHLVALWVVVDAIRSLKTFFSPTAPLLRWATFALHPLLLVLAFGLCAPLGAVADAVYRFAGLSHALTDALHLALSSAAVVLGWLGIWDMWSVHSNDADAQIAKGWGVHFQSAHSWIGIVVMLAFTSQWLGGVAIFGPTPLRGSAAAQRAREGHALLERYSVYGGLVAVITGILSLAGRGDNVAAKDVAFKTLAMAVLLLAVSLSLLFVGPLPTVASLTLDGRAPLTIGISEGAGAPVGIPVTYYPTAEGKTAPGAPPAAEELQA